MKERPVRSIPPALVVVLVAGLLGSTCSALLQFARTGLVSIDHLFWVSAVGEGLTWAVHALFAAALIELADRSTGQLRLWFGAAAFVPLFRLASQVVVQLGFLLDMHALQALEVPLLVAQTLATLGFGLVIVGAAAVSRRGLLFAIIAALAAGVHLQMPGIRELVLAHLYSADASKLVLAARVIWLTCTVLALGQMATVRPVLESPNAAARGYGRMGLGLMMQVIAPLVLVMSGVLARSPSGLHAIMALAFLTLVGSWTLVGSGLFDVLRSALPGAAPGRLAVALACFAVAAAIRADQLVQLVQHDVYGSRWELIPIDRGVLTVPVLNFLAFALVGSAISSVASARGDTRIAAMAMSRTIAFVFVQVGLLAIHYLIGIDLEPLDASALFGIIAAVVTIAMTVAYANLLHQTSEALKRVAFLPSARLL